MRIEQLFYSMGGSKMTLLEMDKLDQSKLVQGEHNPMGMIETSTWQSIQKQLDFALWN